MRFHPLLIVATLSAPAPATLADGPALTLEQAQIEARQHAPERTVVDAKVAATETRASAAGHRFTHDPIVIARYQQPAPGGDSEDHAWSVGLEWTLDLSGAWRSRRAAARATVTAAIEDRTSALLELDAEVAVTFAELADAQRRGARSARMVALRDLAARAADRMRTAGQGNQLDADAATLDLRAAQVDAANTRGDLDAACARLARLLGRREPAGLFVADDVDTTAAPSVTATDELVARDPGVRMATAELDAARLAAEAERQAARLAVTVGIEAGRTRHDIPSGAFASAPTLTGSWSEWEVALSLSVPLPIIDRNRVARAATNADALVADARLTRMRADVRRNIIEAQARLAAAIAAVNAAVEIPQIIERESQLLDKALRAGGIELASFAQQAHRLVEVGRVYDDTVLIVRRARAAWARLVVR